jgi:hypothetical protein
VRTETFPLPGFACVDWAPATTFWAFESSTAVGSTEEVAVGSVPSEGVVVEASVEASPVAVWPFVAAPPSDVSDGVVSGVFAAAGVTSLVSAVVVVEGVVGTVVEVVVEESAAAWGSASAAPAERKNASPRTVAPTASRKRESRVD